MLPEAKGGAGWLDQDTVLLSTALDGTTSSGYASTVRLWRRGTAWSDAPVCSDRPGKHERMGRFRPPTSQIIFGERTGFFDTTAWLGDRDGPKQRLDLPTDAWYALGTRLAGGPRPHGLDGSGA